MIKLVMHGLTQQNGLTPRGSNNTPVILAKIDSTEKEKHLERIKLNSEQEKPENIDLWYAKVSEPQTYNHNTVTPRIIEQVKEIEQVTFRESQAFMNNHNIDNIEDLEYEYGIKNSQIKVGSNKDWYMIYGEQNDGIMISDFAVVGGINAENNGKMSQKTDAMLAIFEATNEIYKVMLETREKGQRLYCNATSDTSLVNIKSMMKSGVISVKDINGRKLKLNGKDIVYESTEEAVETRGFEEDENIQMMDLEIVINIEKLKQEQEKMEKLLAKAKDRFIMKGAKKEEGLDEMRKEIR